MQPSKENHKLTFIDAFAGCGGLSLGLMQAGCKGLFAIEKDKFAFETLRSNLVDREGRFHFVWKSWLPRKPISINTLLRKHRDDLKTLTGRVDLLVGGPPCQGFSMAGKRKHNDPRNKLFKSYLELVELLRPRIVLLENVRGFTTDFNRDGQALNYSEKLKETLSSNYAVYEELIDVRAFGVPQGRIRYFLIAIEPGLCVENPFDLIRAHLPTFLRSAGLHVPVSSATAISDMEVSRNGRRPSTDTPKFEEIAYKSPSTHYQRLLNAGTECPGDLRLARHMAEIERRFAKIIEISHAEGRLNKSISKDLKEKLGLKKCALRVLDPDKPSPTVTSMPDDLLHYAEPRTLTVRENARLQSFPDWFNFKGKYTTGGSLRRREVPRFTQVANAVPPLVAKAIGEVLTKILNQGKKRVTDKKTVKLPRAQRLMHPPEITAEI